jgi:hypothetical protein
LWFAGAFLPRWCEWNNAEITEDLDGSGTQETVLLKNRRVTIQRGSETLYSFPLLWRVMDAFASDLDQDGKKELILMSEELPTPESWENICTELKRAGLEDVEVVTDGIKINLQQ